MELKLYFWPNLLLGSQHYVVFSVATDLEQAKQLAIANISSSQYKEIIEKHVNSFPVRVYEKPASFILGGGYYVDL